MRIRSTLLASVITGAVVAGSLLVAPGAEAAPASGSIVARTPCIGPTDGYISLTAGPAADGTTVATATVTGVEQKYWKGGLSTGSSSITDPTDLSKLGSETAAGGRFTASRAFPDHWPEGNVGAIFMPKGSGRISCDVSVFQAHGLVVEEMMLGDIMVQTTGAGSVRVDLGVNKGAHWKVVATIVTPAGAQHRTRKVKSGKNGLSVTFRSLEKVAAFTSVTVKASNGKPGGTGRFELTRVP